MFDECSCDFDGEGEAETLLDSEVFTTEWTIVECCECGDELEPDTRFEVDLYADEGAPRAYFTCIPCARIRRSLFRCGWIYGEMWERLKKQYGLTSLSEDEPCFDGDWPETLEEKEVMERAKNRRELQRLMDATADQSRFSPARPVYGSIGAWRCTNCGAVRRGDCSDDGNPGAWRYVDCHWEHKCPGAHPQLGHFQAERIE